MCLGDLGDGVNEPPPIAVDGLSRPIDGEAAVDEVNASQSADSGHSDSGKIAHLLPCGHDLHNDCLKPWVERANSCPICRQSFNVVELLDTLGGKWFFVFSSVKSQLLC